MAPVLADVSSESGTDPTIFTAFSAGNTGDNHRMKRRDWTYIWQDPDWPAWHYDLFEGKLTSSKWASIAKCSPDTALRDINDLLALGALQKSASGGRSTWYELGSQRRLDPS
jgi:hypothetical protein